MKQSRRSFLRNAAVGLASLPMLAGFISIPSALGADADLPPLKPDDTTAKSLGFCVDADKPTTQCAMRKGKDKAGQYCGACQLYTKVKGEGNDEMGKCIVLSKGLVPTHGWCSSWVKRPV